MFNSNGLSPADVLALNGRNDGFGGEGGWWFIIVLFALFGGWGRGGMFGGNGGGVTDGYVLTNDFSMLSRQLSDGFGSQERKLDSISNGICSLGYDQLAQMNGINTNILQTGFGLQQAINGVQVNDSNNARDIMAQMAQCCCDNQKTALQAQYNLASESCATRQAVADAKADILEAIKQQSIDAMQTKINEQAQIINNQCIVAQLQPKVPIPAYIAPNPFCNCNNGYPFGYAGTTIA